MMITATDINFKRKIIQEIGAGNWKNPFADSL